MAATDWETVSLLDVLERVKRPITLQPNETYRTLGVRLRVAGVFTKEPLKGSEISAKTLFQVEPEDVIYSRLFAWRGSFGVVGDEHAGCVVSGEFPTFRARESLRPAFFLLWASQPSVWEAAELLSTGTTSGSRNRLKEDDFLTLEIDLPPIEEQDKIVSAVEAADNAFKSAQTERDALADLLRSAQHELFGRLDVDEVRLGDIAKVGPGSTPSRNNPSYFGGDVAWVKTGDIRFRDLTETSETLTEAGLASCAARLLPEGSVVLAMIGQGATRGRAAVLRRPMATNQNAAGIVPSERLDGRYLFHWLWMNYDDLRGGAEGTSQPALSARIVSNFELPLPPIEDQRAIVQELDVIHRALVEAEDRLAPLTELRASFIDSLLSGARRVRDRRPAVEELAVA